MKKLAKKSTSPFTHVTDDYKTVVDRKEATCASKLSLSTVNTVLGDKKKPMSWYASNRKNSKKDRRCNALQTQHVARAESQ